MSSRGLLEPFGIDMSETLPGTNRWDELHSGTLRTAKDHYKTRSTLHHAY